MRFLSGTDASIAFASKHGLLKLKERPSRLGGTYVAIEDDLGVIEIANTMADAEKRVAQVTS